MRRKAAQREKRRGQTLWRNANDHRREQVAVIAQCAALVAAQRNIHVILEESGESHVPSPPKINHAGRLVW